MKYLILLIMLTACKIDALWRPLPDYVWGCAEYKVMTITVNNQVSSSIYCTRMGWIRKVDTIPLIPKGYPDAAQVR